MNNDVSKRLAPRARARPRRPGPKVVASSELLLVIREQNLCWPKIGPNEPFSVAVTGSPTGRQLQACPRAERNRVRRVDFRNWRIDDFENVERGGGRNSRNPPRVRTIRHDSAEQIPQNGLAG